MVFLRKNRIASMNRINRYNILESLRRLPNAFNPLNPSFCFLILFTSTSYVESTAACACRRVVAFIMDSGEFGSLYAAVVPPAELIIGILALNEGVGGSVDAAAADADILSKITSSN